MKSRWSRREFLKSTGALMVLGAPRNSARCESVAVAIPAETSSWENGRNDLDYRVRLRQPILLHSGRKCRAGAARARSRPRH